MSLASVIAIITAFMLFLNHHFIANYQKQIVAAEADATARNILVYRRAVNAYLAANPGATGTIADAALTLPSWFQKTSGLTNVISAGVSYTYTTTPPPGVVSALISVTNNSATVGLKTSGVLINPNSTTNLSIPVNVPSSVPDGAVVIVG